jgi:hypothetical protein
MQEIGVMRSSICKQRSQAAVCAPGPGHMQEHAGTQVQSTESLPPAAQNILVAVCKPVPNRRMWVAMGGHGRTGCGHLKTSQALSYQVCDVHSYKSYV